MTGRDVLGVLQLPVALAGIALLAWAAVGLATLPPPPPGGDGLPGGLAALFLAGIGWLGFVVLAIGLASRSGTAPVSPSRDPNAGCSCWRPRPGSSARYCRSSASACC